MAVSGRRKSVIFFITLGSFLVALAIALNVGWILLNWRQVALLVLGIIFFMVIIVGVVLNTTFLIREIRRNEQHDAFINAVTHELKTPLASIRLYLETLKTRNPSEAQRENFYDIMLADSDRLLHTVEQVLRAGHAGHRRRRLNPTIIDIGEMVRECLDLTRIGITSVPRRSTMVNLWTANELGLQVTQTSCAQPFQICSIMRSSILIKR